MIHVIQTETLPVEAVGAEGVGGRRSRLITPETVGAGNVEADFYELASGASSETFRVESARQFFYVLRGAAKAELGDLRQGVRAGHGIYAEAGEVCRFTDCSDDGLGFIRFTIPPAHA